MASIEAGRATGQGSGLAGARWWHLATFAVAAVGVGFQVWLEVGHPISPDRPPYTTAIRVANVFSFFTIWSNVLTAVVALLLAADPTRRGTVFAVLRHAVLTMITLTGLVYALVLAPVWSPTGWAKVADNTLHYAVPFLAIVGYLLFGPRPRFTTRTLWWALAFPVVWIIYTLLRGPQITYVRDGETRHFWPYHFINVDDLGYGRVAVNALFVLVVYLALAALYLYLDRKLPSRPRSRPREATFGA